MPLELRAGQVALAIDDARGGRIASLAIGGTELIVGPPDGQDAGYGWGCFLMAPWAGRIEDGRLAWHGERHHLTATSGPHAIHGVTYGTGWSVVSAGPADAILECDLGAAGWPFGGRVRQTFQLAPGGLTVTAEHFADRPTPTVIGWHPWFRTDGGGASVALAAAERLELDALIPTGRRLPVDARTDLRAGALLDGRRLDDVYPNVTEPAIVRWPSLTLTIGLEPGPATFVVFTRPGAFCVEPQTGWPNAVALAANGVAGTGLRELEAGEQFTAAMTWRWSTGPG